MKNALTSTHDWLSLTTEGSMLAFAAVLIVVCAFARASFWDKRLSLIGISLLLAALFMQLVAPASIVCPSADGLYFDGSLDAKSSFGVFVIFCAILSALMTLKYFDAHSHRPEFISILMISAASLSIFVRSNNLMLSFVALEAATVSFYALAAWNRSRGASLEAAAKYLVIGGVSGAIFLLGIAFVYGAALRQNVDLLSLSNFHLGLRDPLFITGIVLAVSGMLFKMAAFPFQFWAPDVYQGAPTPLSAFLAVASKGAGAAFLMKIFGSLNFEAANLPAYSETAALSISIIAAATILVGNLGGITQVNTKRLSAFSGISNAGYMLVLIAAVAKMPALFEVAEVSLYFYLLAYMFANYGVFFVINQFGSEEDWRQNFADYRGLLFQNKTLSSTLIIALSSLAGIPPSAGFFGKVLILVVALAAQLYWLVAILIIGSAISIYYYFGWIRASADNYTPEKHCRTLPVGKFAPIMYGISIVTLLFGAVLIYKI